MSLSKCRPLILASGLIAMLYGSASAYDESWYKTDFWAGEYPHGFSLKEDAAIPIRSAPDPGQPQTIDCQLKQYSTFHVWNAKRVKSDRLEFVSYVPTARYRVKQAAEVHVHNEQTKTDTKLALKVGDEWTELTYYGEGAFKMRFQGVEYGAEQDLYEVSEEIPGPNKGKLADQWMKLACANGTEGWLLAKDVAENPAFGGPHILSYGRAADLPRVIEARPPEPVQVKARQWLVAKAPQHLAHDGKSLWVSDAAKRRLVRLNPRNGRVERRVKVGRLPWDVYAAPDGTVYSLVITDQIVWRQPRRGKGKALKWFQHYPISMSSDGKALWIGLQKQGNDAESLIARLNPKTGAIKTSQYMSLTGLGQLTAAHGKIWTTHGGQGWGGVARFDPETLQEADQLSLQKTPGLIAAGKGGVFVSGAIGIAGNFLSKFDAEGGEETHRLSFKGDIHALGTSGEYVIAALGEGRIWIISADDLSIVREIDAGVGTFLPAALLAVGDTLYVSTSSDRGGKASVLAINGWLPE